MIIDKYQSKNTFLVLIIFLKYLCMHLDCTARSKLIDKKQKQNLPFNKIHVTLTNFTNKANSYVQ